MQGLLIFTSLADALKAGFHVYDRTENGYLVRSPNGCRLGLRDRQTQRVIGSRVSDGTR